jgi:hypothetical protein
MERKHGCAGCLTILAVAAVVGLVLDRPSSNKPSVEPAPAVPVKAELFATYSIGQEIWLGDWSYKVIGAEWLPSTPLKDILGPEIQSPQKARNARCFVSSIGCHRSEQQQLRRHRQSKSGTEF